MYSRYWHLFLYFLVLVIFKISHIVLQNFCDFYIHSKRCDICILQRILSYIHNIITSVTSDNYKA